MANWENFSGNCEFAPAVFPRSAEPALDLSGFKNGLLQFRVIAAERIQFVPEELNTALLSVPTATRVWELVHRLRSGRQRQVTAGCDSRAVQYFFG